MMKYLSTLVRAAAASLFIAGAAQAAPINFTINSAASGGTATCSGPFGDTTCNFGIALSPSLPTPVVVEQGGSTTFPFLVFTAVGTDRFGADSANIVAKLAFSSPNGLFNVGGTGTGIVTIGGFFLGSSAIGSALVWSNPIAQFFPNVGTVSVALENVGSGIFTIGQSFVVNAKITIAPIPLPGGVVLLGTALLGLFGLSRRRKQAAA